MPKELTSPPAQKKPVNRREFLNLAWLASLGFLTVSMGGMTYLFAMPRFKAGEFGGKVDIGKVSELPAVDAGPANFPKVKFWLSNSPDGVSAIYKVCTHLGCLYNWRDQEGRFICPCHGSQFEKNGTYIRGPAPRSLDRFVVEIVDPATNQVIASTNEKGEPIQVPGDPNAVIRVDTGKRIKGAVHG
jgi:cytochrome b6-f complex iron-sulfur subunit